MVEVYFLSRCFELLPSPLFALVLCEFLIAGALLTHARLLGRVLGIEYEQSLSWPVLMSPAED